MLIRKHFPQTHILVRGDGHFSGQEMMRMIAAMPNTNFIFGLPGNVKLQALSEPTKQRACALWADVQTRDVVPDAVRLYDEFTYTADSWSKAWRVLLKAGVMALGENPRFVVTSLNGLDAGSLYEELYCTRGQAKNFIKHRKCDLASNRTSCTSFLAKHGLVLVAGILIAVVERNDQPWCWLTLLSPYAVRRRLAQQTCSAPSPSRPPCARTDQARSSGKASLCRCG